MLDDGIKVVAQKVDPEAVITKNKDGFETTIICVLETGIEHKHRVSRTRKKDIVAKLQKLPVDNVQGMRITSYGFTMELFTYNGV